MATQYTSILKLALPVTGELSGTWGDVVNDNITSMVEEAIAGRAAIDTWTANSHTLTTADGTTSEARAAILTLTDTGTALTGAGTVICPAASKIYIVENGAGQTITVKTASGTGIAVPDGKNMVVFCDGTNVEEGITNINSLTLNGDGATVSSIKDEDNMASDSATALATQQSIKAYVDTQIGVNNELSEVLANGNTTGGTDISVSSGDDITFADNGKAIFGAGSDLQIYHSGTASIIDDAGQGDLIVRSSGSKIRIYDQANTQNMANFFVGGSVQLYHNGSEKLETTNTGVDVTGTATMDGLTVGGDILVNRTSAFTNAVIEVQDDGDGEVLALNNNGTDGQFLRLYNSGTLIGGLGNRSNDVSSLNLYRGSTPAINIDNGGDISFYEDTGTTPKLTWDASAESLNFADNGKAIFGDGSDLQIYHDGSNSYITDSGTGNLRIAGTLLQLNDASFNKYLLGSGDSVTLYNADSAKLATTSTGIDVTGTVKADGLTVDGDATIGQASGGDRTLSIGSAGATHFDVTTAGATGIVTLNATNDSTAGKINLQTADTDRLLISNNGDISFYEDTGTTAKMFWDASAERLGLGTSSPGATLDVDGTVDIAPSSGDAQLKILNSANTGRSLIYFSDPGGTGGRMVYNHAANFMSFETNGTNEAMRIDASGNVGIGNSSPGNFNSSAERLVIGGGTGDEGMTVYSSPTGRGSLFFADATSGTALYAGYVQYSHSSNNMVFGTDSTTKVTLTSSGNLGIGTSSPARALHISTSADRIAKFESTDASAFIVLEDSNSTSDYNRIGVTTHDMQFITNNSEAMRIDSSGNVGIGTTSPNSTLEVSGTSAGGEVEGLRLTNSSTTTNSSSSLIFNLSTASADSAKIEAIRTNSPTSSDTELAFSQIRNGTLEERMRINSAGNVGIGTTSPSAKLHVDNGAGSAFFVGFSNSNYYRAGQHVFQSLNNTSEYMRIDASGNTLFGTTLTPVQLSTTSNNADQGVGISSSGLISGANEADVVLSLNRLGTDGAIASFRKNGSQVGAIGTNSGSLFIGSGDTGLNMRADLNAIYPWGPTGGAQPDVIDLGYSTVPFKDLYLSGGAYLGGTAAANKLDDYEEGTWSPVFEPDTGSFAAITMDVIQARYTKVGNVVTINCYIRTDNLDVTGASGNVKITGVPFFAYSSSAAHIGYASGFNTAPAGGYVFSSRINLTLPVSGGGSSQLAVSNLTDGALANKNEIVLTATYHTSA